MAERWITKEDFEKAKAALVKANVSGPITVWASVPVEDFNESDKLPDLGNI